MDKFALEEKIKKMAEFSNDEKSALVELLRTQKKYGLVWEDKPENIEERMRKELPLLTEVKGRAVISDNEDAPNHILIEGDNLEALTTLSYTHTGKIDVIYIDPPYNRGSNKKGKKKNDFRYNDRYVDENDEYRHSKWLSFMNKRLKIAKQLLSDKGVIFISIDDIEQAQLKLLCDEIFGQQNFLGQLIIETATDNNPSQINTEHEYMVCYAKNKSKQSNWSIKSTAAPEIISQYNKLKKKYSNIEEIEKNLRKWIKKNKDKLPQVGHYNKVDEKGVFSSSSNSSNPHPGGYTFDILHPETGKPCPKPKNGWRWPYNTFLEYDKYGEVQWGEDESTQPHIKKRIETATEYLRSIIYEDNRKTTYSLSDLFGGHSVFENPKPTSVLQRIIDFSSNENSIILDFFAGSGTTLHATMQLNAEDGGKRKCILATNNENNICEEVTYERNKRVIQGYTTPKGKAIAGLKGNNLRYYKTCLIPRERTIKNKRNLVEKATDMLCIRNDVYTESKLGDKEFDSGILRYFDNGKTRMMVIYQEEAIPLIVEQLVKFPLTKGSKIKVYVFSPNNYAFNDDFMDVADKVELCALPAAIYEAYKNILPRQESETKEDGEQEPPNGDM